MNGRRHRFQQHEAGSFADGNAIAEQAGMLGLDAAQFNRAQMQALSFADTMEL